QITRPQRGWTAQEAEAYSYKGPDRAIVRGDVMEHATVDALVVGAGPVGLTMAATLIHQGLRCRIIDKAPAPNDKSKALVVSSRSLELLDGIGLADTFVQAGMKIHGASMYSSGKRLVHVVLADAGSPFGFPLMIPQNETERLLAEHLVKHGVT